MTSPAPKPANDSRGHSDAEAELYLIENEGPMSPEKIFERLSEARNKATIHSNRFLVAGLLFVGLSLIKLSGLRIDLSLLDTKVMAIPYGGFFYIIAAQISFSFSTMRISDARSYDHEMMMLSRRVWSERSKSALRTFPNVDEWLTPSTTIGNQIKGHSLAKFFVNLSSFTSFLLGSILFTSPIIIGFFYINHWETFINSGNIDLQYWTVLGGTV